jgi:predicted thioesterase
LKKRMNIAPVTFLKSPADPQIQSNLTICGSSVGGPCLGCFLSADIAVCGFQGAMMNTLQKLGALFFEVQHQVAAITPRAPTAAHSAAVDHLTPMLEQLCTQQVMQVLGNAPYTVDTAQIALLHRAPALPGAQLVVRGWVQRLGWETVGLELEVRDRFQLVCEGTLTLALQRTALIKAPETVPITTEGLHTVRAPLLKWFFSNMAMAGRTLPLVLWCMASVLLVVATLFTLLPNAQHKTTQAVQQQHTQQAQQRQGG